MPPDDRLYFTGDLRTTTMGILPHRDVDEALAMALSVDIPFWPQLPMVSFDEDMYVQAMEHFPGVVIDRGHRRIFVETNRFIDELVPVLDRWDDPGFFSPSLSPHSSYRRFMEADLLSYAAIRGQMMSPVSLGLRIMDEKGKPIVYNDEIRGFLFTFIQMKVNRQYHELKEKNRAAFVWLDDPGLEFIFSALCGYDPVLAKREMSEFLDGLEGPRGIHLCGRPDWDFLLSLDIELLSFNAYAHGDVFATYDRVARFFDDGRTISWGIVPTVPEEISGENVARIAGRLEGMWLEVEKRGVSRERIVRNSLLAPATCNLANPDKTATVERSFRLLNDVSQYLRGKLRL